MADFAKAQSQKGIVYLCGNVNILFIYICLYKFIVIFNFSFFFLIFLSE